MSGSSWDYLIIGAGHNGLTAACTLAMAGRSVLVLEQRHLAGGLAASHAYLPEAPAHLLSIGAMDDALMAHSPLVDLLRLRDFGYRATRLERPYGWMGPEGETLILHADFDRTVEEIRYFSAADAKTYIELRGVIDLVNGALEKVMPHHPARLPRSLPGRILLKLAVDRTIRRQLGRMLSVSAFEMISETFESEAMRGLWAFWSSMFAPATAQASGLYLASFGGVHRSGIFRPRGGMGSMINALEQALVKHRGELRLSHQVEQLLLESGRVSGVRLAGGQELRARHAVLASCAPQLALGQLLPAGVQEQGLASKLAFMPASSAAVAPFKIDMAVAGPLDYTKAQARRSRRDGIDLRRTTFMTGTLEQQIAQHQACLRGEPVPFPPPLYFSILSANDDSLAPPGQDVLYLYAHAPVQPVGGWAAQRSAWSKQVMTAARQHIDGLDAEIGRIETSPEDFETQFGAPRGAYFHIDMLPSRLGMNRPAAGLGGYRTAVGGLYLAGAGSHPCGGVCGWPGRLAALHAMENENSCS